VIERISASACQTNAAFSMMMSKPVTGLCTRFAAEENIAWSDPYSQCLKVRRPSLALAPVAVCPRNTRLAIRDEYREFARNRYGKGVMRGMDRRKELGCLVI
jgi:hypothetical protein